MTYRDEFSVKVRKAAYDRAEGICECGCGQPFGKERIEYDHILPDFLGGTNDLENCQAIRLSCHKAKTASDMRAISKTRRIRNKQRGLTATKPPFPGSKNSRFKKCLDGTVIDRRTGEPV